MNKYKHHSKSAERRACTLKTAYATPAAAACPGFKVYPCKFCGLWHRAQLGGHPLKPRSPRRTSPRFQR